MQPILLAARDAAVIDPPTYLKATVGLAGYRHSHTCVTSDDLLAAFHGEAGATYNDFAHLVAQLGGKNAQPESHAGVVIRFPPFGVILRTSTRTATRQPGSCCNV